MLVDYRTLRHKASHIVFVDSMEGVDAAVFSSLGSAVKFLKLMNNYEATLHTTNGEVAGFMKDGRIVLYL